MLMITTMTLALASALVSHGQAAALDPNGNFAARQALPCPTNGLACGWFLLNGAATIPCPGATTTSLGALAGNADLYNSIYRVNGTGYPVAFYSACAKGCTEQQPNVPVTHCNP